MRCNYTELTCKEVVNVVDGCRLGAVSDVVIDMHDGRIVALVVPQPGKYWGLFSSGVEHVIPFDRVVKVGDDIVLVEFAPLKRE